MSPSSKKQESRTERPDRVVLDLPQELGKAIRQEATKNERTIKGEIVKRLRESLSK